MTPQAVIDQQRARDAAVVVVCLMGGPVKAGGTVPSILLTRDVAAAVVQRAERHALQLPLRGYSRENLMEAVAVLRTFHGLNDADEGGR